MTMTRSFLMGTLVGAWFGVWFSVGYSVGELYFGDDLIAEAR